MLPISIQLDTLLHGIGLTKDESIKVAKEVQQFYSILDDWGIEKRRVQPLVFVVFASLLCNYIHVYVYEYVTMKCQCCHYENVSCHYVT